MRLIDADKCPCTKCDSMDDCCQHTCGMLKEWLNTTAYDVDKVVEELERLGRIAFIYIANTGKEENDTAYAYVSRTVDEAVEIVRRGEVDERKN